MTNYLINKRYRIERNLNAYGDVVSYTVYDTRLGGEKTFETFPRALEACDDETFYLEKKDA